MATTDLPPTAAGCARAALVILLVQAAEVSSSAFRSLSPSGGGGWSSGPTALEQPGVVCGPGHEHYIDDLLGKSSWNAARSSYLRKG